MIWQMCQYPGIGKFEVDAFHMEVTLVNDYQNAYNIISLTSNLDWG